MSIEISKKGWMAYTRNGIEIFPDKEKAAKVWEKHFGFAVDGVNYNNPNAIAELFENLEKEYNNFNR